MYFFLDVYQVRHRWQLVIYTESLIKHLPIENNRPYGMYLFHAFVHIKELL